MDICEIVIHGLIQQRLANLNSLIVETQTMTKKNLKPQQAAPVRREINTTSSEDVTGLGLTPFGLTYGPLAGMVPFAGDDAE